MFIGKKRDLKLHDLQLSFDDIHVYQSSVSDSVKFLGAHIDASISMSCMISDCVSQSLYFQFEEAEYNQIRTWY